MTGARTTVLGLSGDHASPLPVPTSAGQPVPREWNGTARPYPRHRCIHEWFERQARQQPDAVALLSAEERWSYGQLEARSAAVAAALQDRGVGPGDHVAVAVRRSPELVAALLGVLRAGAAYVPLDPRWPPARMTQVMQCVRPALLIVDAAHADALASCRTGVPRLDPAALLLASPQHGSQQQPLPRHRPCRMSAAYRAYVIFTSGSTGTPKGVAVAHRPLSNLFDFMHRTFHVTPADRLLWVTAPTFDLSVFDIFGMLAAGGSVRIADEQECRDPQRLLRIIETEGITLWDSAPAAMQQLFMLDAPPPSPTSTLRLVLLSGDFIPLALPKQIRNRFPAAQVVALGGATEAAVWSNYFVVGEIDPGWRSIPYGRPIQNACYYALDEAGRPCPIGTTGELYIGGECLAEGYAGDESRTIERFLPDPFVGGEARMYRTGDAVRWRADGNMEILGRVDRQVKLRGYRVELGEIEAALQRLPGITGAVADVSGAGEERRLLAWVTAEGGSAVNEASTREQLRAALPEYMIPSRVLVLAAFPLNSSGKIDRRQLPMPGEVAVTPDDVPRYATEAERALGAIWQRILGRGGIRRDTSFFDLGGDSFSALRMLRDAAAVGIHITPAMMQVRPTIASLCERAAAMRVSSAAMSPVQPERLVPLTPTQQWFFERRLPDPQHYSTVHVFALTRPISRDCLSQASDALVERHPALRLRFHNEGGEWRQRLASPVDAIGWSTCDLSGIGSDAQLHGISAATLEARRSLDLAAGPLLHLLLFDSGAHAPPLLAIVAHHLIFDGVSLEILIEDLTRSLDSAQRREPVRLPAATGFDAWADALARRATQTDWTHALSRLRHRGFAAARPLRVDYDLGPNDYSALRTLRHTFTGARPSAAALLTGLARGLSELSSAAAVLIDDTAHGRDGLPDFNAARTIGYVTTIYPLLLMPAAADAAESQLAASREFAIDYGIMRYLASPAVRSAVAALPEAQVKFNYQAAAPPMSPLMRWMPWDAPGLIAPHSPRRYLLNIEAYPTTSAFVVEIKYSAHHHHERTMRRLMQQITQAAANGDADGPLPARAERLDA